MSAVEDCNNNNNGECEQEMLSTITNLDEKSYSCELCSITVSSLKILQRHLEGRKHKMKVERNGKTFKCELCNVTANSEIQLNIHLNSSKHNNKLLKKDTDKPTSTKGLCILFFGIFCIFINLLLLFKIICTD